MAVSAGSLCHAQEGYPSNFFGVHGAFEQFFVIQSGKKPAATQSFFQVSSNFNASLSFVGSYAQIPGDRWVEDTYLQYSSGLNVMRAGRFRSAFGFSNWSELYYTPIIGLPMIRAYGQNLTPGTPLNRLDRGFDLQGGRPALQYQVALVDAKDNDWQITPSSPNTLVGRIQAAIGPVMIGLNGLAQISGSNAAQRSLGGMDFRWTAPRLQLRGEVVRGIGTKHVGGYYVDLFYRPPKLARTQVGARIQGVQALATTSWTTGYSNGAGWGPAPSTFDQGEVYTLAVRQFLSPQFTLSVNYGVGAHIPEAQGLRGWSVQLQSSFRF